MLNGDGSEFSIKWIVHTPLVSEAHLNEPTKSDTEDYQTRKCYKKYCHTFLIHDNTYILYLTMTIFAD